MSKSCSVFPGSGGAVLAPGRNVAGKLSLEIACPALLRAREPPNLALPSLDVECPATLHKCESLNPAVVAGSSVPSMLASV